jgi:hypothetical protein
MRRAIWRVREQAQQPGRQADQLIIIEAGKSEPWLPPTT